MAEVTNPEAVRFVDAVIRPLAERLRDANVIMDEAAAEWIGQNMSAYFANGTDPVHNAREAQGVSSLTAQDVTDFVAVVAQIRAVLAAAGVMDTVRKPCVRELAIAGG